MKPDRLAAIRASVADPGRQPWLSLNPPEKNEVRDMVAWIPAAIVAGLGLIVLSQQEGSPAALWLGGLVAVTAIGWIAHGLSRNALYKMGWRNQ